MQMGVHSPGSDLAGFVSLAKIVPGLTLVTGSHGSGKTSWCLAVVRRAYAAGLRLGGLVSPSVFKNGRKVGLELLDLATGERRLLACRRGNAFGDLWTTNWQLVAETLEWGNSVLERLRVCDLFLLDEIGPLEFDHGVGFVAGLDWISLRKNIPTMVTVRPSLVPIARLRWPWATVLDLSATTPRSMEAYCSVEQG